MNQILILSNFPGVEGPALPKLDDLSELLNVENPVPGKCEALDELPFSLPDLEKDRCGSGRGIHVGGPADLRIRKALLAVSRDELLSIPDKDESVQPLAPAFLQGDLPSQSSFREETIPLEFDLRDPDPGSILRSLLGMENDCAENKRRGQPEHSQDRAHPEPSIRSNQRWKTAKITSSPAERAKDPGTIQDCHFPLRKLARGREFIPSKKTMSPMTEIMEKAW
jgi:hypothetical protein